MSDTYCVRRCFEQPAENHGHPGSISRVILGPGASNPERPEAIDSERLIIHTNEYEVGGVSGDGHSHNNQEQFFYLQEDPHKCRDLAPAGGSELERWRAHMVTELEHREEGLSDGEKLIPGQVPVWRFGSADELHLG